MATIVASKLRSGNVADINGERYIVESTEDMKGTTMTAVEFVGFPFALSFGRNEPVEVVL